MLTKTCGIYDSVFLGRPEYDWLVSDGLFQPFKLLDDYDFVDSSSVSDWGPSLWEQYSIPIFAVNFHNNHQWNWIGNFYYYLDFDQINDQAKDRSENGMNMYDHRYGWPIKWTIDGWKYKLSPYVQSLKSGFDISRGIFYPDKGPMKTVVKDSQYVTANWHNVEEKVNKLGDRN